MFIKENPVEVFVENRCDWNLHWAFAKEIFEKNQKLIEESLVLIQFYVYQS